MAWKHRPGKTGASTIRPMTCDIMRTEGFDHVRIPVGWHHYTGPGPDFRIRPEIFARADELVNAGLHEGLGVMINIHHFDDFTSDPKGQTARFLAIWRQVAEHYAKAPAGLAFELLNEPKDAATTEVINPIFAEAIRQIREIAPKRTIFVGPGRWNSVGELPKLLLPDDDQNLIVTVHNYDPFYFTHQGADWAGPDTKMTGILFPGPPCQAAGARSRSSRSIPGCSTGSREYNTEPTATNPSSPRGISRGDRPGQGVVGILRPADPYRRVRLLHDGRPGFACQLLPFVPRIGRKSRDRLGHLGLEGRVPLLERQDRQARAGHA